MIRHFICLANSKKYGERCIAGIEIELDKAKGTYRIIRNGQVPQWIRPVSDSEHGEVGEVAADLVESISLNDIVELDIITEAPKGYQSENMLFNPKSIEIASKIKPSEKALDNLVREGCLNLFGNKGAAIHPDAIDSIGFSILLIKVGKPIAYRKETDYNGKKSIQLRMKFKFNGNDYDLAVTDLDFIKEFELNDSVLDSFSIFYLTISLGVIYNGWYHKLVAGVIMI